MKDEEHVKRLVEDVLKRERMRIKEARVNEFEIGVGGAIISLASLFLGFKLHFGFWGGICVGSLNIFNIILIHHTVKEAYKKRGGDSSIRKD